MAEKARYERKRPQNALTLLTLYDDAFRMIAMATLFDKVQGVVRLAQTCSTAAERVMAVFSESTLRDVAIIEYLAASEDKLEMKCVLEGKYMLFEDYKEVEGGLWNNLIGAFRFPFECLDPGVEQWEDVEEVFCSKHSNALVQFFGGKGERICAKCAESDSSSRPMLCHVCGGPEATFAMDEKRRYCRGCMLRRPFLGARYISAHCNSDYSGLSYFYDEAEFEKNACLAWQNGVQ